MAKQRRGEREAFWREQVRRQAASRLSVRRFCEEKGLSEPSFYAWRRTLSQRDEAVPVQEFLRAEKGSGLIILLPRTAAGAEGAFQAERGHRLLLPAVAAVRDPPFHAPPQSQQLPFRLRLVDMLLPAVAPFHRTFAIPRGSGGRTRQVEGRVGPDRGGFDEVRPEGISLDIPQHRQQVLVLLDGERFESPLPDVAGGLVVLVVAADVRREQPLHPAGQIAILARPEDQVKMIRHQAISEQPHRHDIVGGGEEADECLIIGRLVKHPLTGISAAEDVVAVATGRVAVRSGHGNMVTRGLMQSQ